MELPHSASADGRSYIREFAERFGITDLKTASRLPNTRKVMAVAEYMRDQGKLAEFRSLVMDAHWRQSRNIEDDTVLRELAASAGADPDKAISAAEDPVYLKRVDDRRNEFQQVKTGGVPTFVIGDEVIEGCQPFGVLAAALIRAGAGIK